MANGSNWSSRKNAYYRSIRAAQKQQNQWQTGGSGSGGGSGGAGGGLAGQYNQAQTTGAGDYTNNDNPALIKYQQQNDPDKMARFLSSVSNNTDLNQYPDGKYGYHDNPMQKLLLRLGINDKPTVMSANDFDNYVAQTGQEVLYRGWTSKNSMVRLTEANYPHTGCGKYGDGFYFGDSSVASGYSGGWMSRAALSPQAKVISIWDLKARMPDPSSKLGRALYKAGHTGERNYYAPHDGYSQWALHLGYNVIDAGWCKCVLTRDALVVSK